MFDAGLTALMGAAEGGHTESVRELLQKGADANAADNDGEWREEASCAAGAQDGGMFEGRGARVLEGGAGSEQTAREHVGWGLEITP